MKVKAFCFIFVLWGMTSQLQADDLAFQFSREVKTSSLEQEELVSVTLDSDVFEATRKEFPDVRLLDLDGNQISYLLRKVQTTRPRTTREIWPARNPSVRPLENGGLEITVTLDEQAPHPHGLSLISPLQNFEQRVQVSTSTDGQQWETTGDETVIFDYSRYMDVRSVSVSFKETGRRHFRIVIDDVTLEQESELLALTRRLRGATESEHTERVTIDRRPFRIERIDFWRDVATERSAGDEKTEYTVTGLQIDQQLDKQQTIILVDSRREPVTSLKLETSSRNFSRHAVVEVETREGVKNSWHQIGTGTLSRIDFKTLKREQLAISFPESRQSRYRIVIENRDSPALDVTGVKAEGDVYELLFLAAPEKRYQLRYGSADAEPASYDTAAIRALLQEGFQPAKAELGKQTALDRVPAFQWSGLLNDRRLLIGVITLLVIALGWGLYHAVKRMDDMPKET